MATAFLGPYPGPVAPQTAATMPGLRRHHCPELQQKCPGSWQLLGTVCSSALFAGLAARAVQRARQQHTCGAVSCRARGGQAPQRFIGLVPSSNPLVLDESEEADPQDAEPKRESFSSTLPDMIRLINGELPAKDFKGCSTGWKSVNDVYRPVCGELTVVTGIPGSGKSEWLISLALDMARNHKWRTAMFMPEHKPDELLSQLLEKFHGKRYCELPEGDSAAVNFLNTHFPQIGSFSQELDIDDILSTAEYYAQTDGLDGVIIDPYNYIARKDTGRVSETDFVSELLTKVKQFAMRNRTHVWVVVHPTKQSQISRLQPSMYDCAGSAHWYNKCDVGIIIRRNRDPAVGSTKEVVIDVQKIRNRLAGQVGKVSLEFDWFSRIYSDLERGASL